MSLESIAKQYDEQIRTGKVVLMKDQDSHYSVLYFYQNSIAHQYQEGYCPIVVPASSYKVIDVLSWPEVCKYIFPKEVK